jgi:hypothetical protein
MKNFGKIVGINLLVLLAYSLLIRLGVWATDAGQMGILGFSAVAVGCHVIVCGGATIGSFASGEHDKGRAWLATTGIVLVVGFSVCLGNGALG